MNRKFPPPSLSYTFFAFAVIILFSGCELYGTVGGDDTNIEGALPSLLQGEWVYIPPSGNSSEAYTISSDTVEYGFGGSASATDYKGKIEFVSNYSANSGLIIIKYTVKPTYPEYNGKDYFAIYYRNLNSGWVQLANTTVLSAPSTPPDVDSLEEAKAKFTRMTIGSYVNWSNVQPQTRIK
jgi:hypothetical protein